jgi:arachidonate 15-lipoxygenase
VNFPQYDAAAFAPNMPAAAYARPPQDAGTLSPAELDAFLLQMLPPPAQAELQLQTVTELTSYQFDRLGYYQDGDFSDAGALALIADFQRALAGVQSTIEARNHPRAAPYPWFLPERIPNSTSI